MHKKLDKSFQFGEYTWVWGVVSMKMLTCRDSQSWLRIMVISVGDGFLRDTNI